jgi:AsmA-like C-terminal region
MTSKNASSSQLAKAGQKADRLLSACKLNMTMDVKEMHYKTFAASALTGSVKMIDNTWFMNNVSFKHADGTVALTGTMKEISSVRNDVAIKAALENVNINKIFVAFGNFSQTAVTDKNIRGVLNADVLLNFQMNNKAVISQRSLSGTTQLSITDGELKGFQPLGKLSRLIFRKRDFTEIKFSELTNEFTVTGNQIHFDRMKINSSVMEMYVEGDYFLDGKADMDIQVPLSNLQKRDWEEISENVTDEGEKGMNIYIKAETDEKGELHFRYNPLKKIRDKREQTIRKFRDRLKVKKK